MKAVILAGGGGTRLHPLTLGRPKPMMPLLDRPVMEHIIGLLKRHGFTDICVTLHYMPQALQSWFGDGAELGVKLRWYVETAPLGTAGSVKACMDFLGEEDFLVISGDAVCDLDLSAALGFHRARRSKATLLLSRQPEPLEYGLVLTADDGRVRQFMEKPDWSRVSANTVNTGIYLLTREAMDRVPAGESFDFGRDLFPRLLAEGAPIYGHVARGYWCDMGDPAAYLRCTADALRGKVDLNVPLPQTAPGLWSAAPLPEGVKAEPPCWIGPGTALSPGCTIGPCTVLSAGTAVGAGSTVKNSVLLEGAGVGEGCTVDGAILDRNARTGRNCVLRPGSVLGEWAWAEDDAELQEGVKVWPGRTVPAGARLTGSLGAGTGRGGIRFGDGGVLRGTLRDLGPETLLTLGSALGAEGRLGLGHAGGECARLLARAAGCGASAAGGSVLVHDGTCPAAGAWMARRYDLPASLFVEQEGERIFLHCFDSRGLPLDRGRRRKLEGAVLRGEARRVGARQVGPWEYVSGVSPAYARDARQSCRLDQTAMTPVAVSVPGDSPADRLLAQCLEEMDCVVLSRRTPGVPGFSAGYGGLRLTAWDEEGAPLSPEQLLTLVCLIELEQGEGRVAVPAGAPEAVERLTESRGGAVLRLDRDGEEAARLYSRQPWVRDAAFAACRICARMSRTGERLKTLAAKAPRFVLLRREVPLRRGRGAVMEALAGEGETGVGEGVRFHPEGASVWLSPLIRRQAVRILVEAAGMEAAEELCARFEEKLRAADADP